MRVNIVNLQTAASQNLADNAKSVKKLDRITKR